MYYRNPGLPYHYNLLSNFILDKIYFLSILSLPYFNEFFRHFLNSSDFNNFFYHHPELYLIYKNYIFDFYINYFSNMYTSLYLLQYNESYISVVLVFFQFLILLFLILLFLITYFCYFITVCDSDNIIDHDYLLFNVLVESEEEVGSMDDMLLSSVLLIYIFFWFFWVNSFVSVVIVTCSLATSFVLFPFLYFLIVFMPISLLYDFGSSFLAYLNGVGKSTSLIVEAIFDYIALSIFFLRLLVQNVRLVFMLFTFIELHEMIILNPSYKNFLLFSDVYSNMMNGINSLFASDNFFFVRVILIRILN